MGTEAMRLPYLKLYITDLLADEKVDAMEDAPFGIYMRLLCRAWTQEPPASLPDDEATWIRWGRTTKPRWEKFKEVVRAPWEKRDDGRWYQKRLEIEYFKAREELERKKAGGRTGGRGRPLNKQGVRENDSIGKLKDTYQQTDSLPIGEFKHPEPQPQPELKPEPEPTPKPPSSAAEREADAANFARCWISANCPSFLRSGPSSFARTILRVGKERAVALVEEARADADVGNPFAYVETKLDNQRARNGPVTPRPTPNYSSRKTHS